MGGARARHLDRCGGRIVALTGVPESYIFAYADEDDSAATAQGESE